MNIDHKLTIADVAEALGVSKTTVSRAISGKGRIGEETRQRVREYIEEHEYVPNVMAKGLAQSRTYNIAMTVPEEYALVNLPFFKKCLMGVCKYAGEEDYDVIVSVTATGDIRQLERIVNNRKVDGVILSRTYTRDIAAAFLKSKGVPFVTIGSTLDMDIVQVDNDHESACRELTSKLLAEGNRHMALLAGDLSHVVTQKRYAGFEAAMKEAGLKIDDKTVFCDADAEENDETLDVVAEGGYDCIICMDDTICVRLLDRLQEKGIRVPEDVRVASFYNSSMLERYKPSITSLQFDAQELGTLACKTLLDIIEGRAVGKKTLLGYEISVKESTK